MKVNSTECKEVKRKFQSLISSGFSGKAYSYGMKKDIFNWKEEHAIKGKFP